METHSIALGGIYFTSAPGLPAQQRTGRLGSELSGSVIDSRAAQNLIHTAIEPIPAAKQEVILRAGLVGKNSTPYSPVARHDFMLLLVDDTVISGSYNFSRSAQYNAENILLIGSEAPADRYSFYIDHLMEKYGRVANK